MAIAGVVLAGGLSRRMGGGDKALLPLAGRPMIAHVIGRVAPQVAALAVNANGDPARFAPFALPILPDPMEDSRGPLAGLLAALEWAVKLPDTTYVVTAPADTPFLPPDLVARLEAAARGTRGIAVARCGTAAHQVCSLWPITLSLALRGWLETGRSRKVMDFIVEGPHGFADFPAMQTPQGAIDPFFNINTPDDLARAEVITAGMVQ